MEKFLAKAVNMQYICDQYLQAYRMTSQGKSLMMGAVIKFLRWKISTAGFCESALLRGLESKVCSITVSLRRPSILVVASVLMIRRCHTQCT
jgi:hypothetical protein